MRTMRNTVAAQIAMKAVVQLTLMATTGMIYSSHLYADLRCRKQEKGKVGLIEEGLNVCGNLLNLGPADSGYM